MEKSYILHGSMALLISETFAKPDFISLWAHKVLSKEFRKIFNHCKPHTKFIIVDGCKSDFPYELFFNAVSQGITVQKKDQQFVIHPRFIFVATAAPEHADGHSFADRFEIIDCSTETNYQEYFDTIMATMN